MTVREATPADLTALAALQSALEEPNPALLDAGVAGTGIVLVSEAGTGADVGDAAEAVITASGGDTPASGETTAPVGYLLAIPGEASALLAELAVAPAYRRQGRAGALLAALFDRCRERGIDRVELTVAVENDAARDCYESAGFEVVGREADFYGSGDALRMVRRLAE